MARWITYTQERFPIFTYLLLTLGISASACVLHKEQFAWSSVNIQMAMRFTFSLFGLCVFFYQLRLMDELKDFEKDTIANPLRPLPRGLLSKSEVLRMIQFLQYCMYIFAISLVVFGFISAGISYAVTTLWLFLMFKEFFIGKWLAKRPLFYAVSHQIVCIPLAAFAVLLFTPFDALEGVNEVSRTCFFGLQVMSGFFVYEVCRKLNPEANPILGTYFVTFGYFFTGLLLSILGILLVLNNSFLASSIALSSSFLVAVLLLGYWFIMNTAHAFKRYKLLELLASLILLHQLWSVAVHFFF